MSETIIIFAALAVNGLLYALVTAVRTAFSMSMGQLTRKNKLLVAIGSWFGTGVAWNILSSMAYVVAMIPILAAGGVGGSRGIRADRNADPYCKRGGFRHLYLSSAGAFQTMFQTQDQS